MVEGWTKPTRKAGRPRKAEPSRPTSLRLEPALEASIRAAAEQNGRGIGAEIEARLARSFSTAALESWLLTDSVRGRLALIAKANARSINDEIVVALEQWLEPTPVPEPPIVEATSLLEIYLDTDGKPTSWPEVQEHLSAVLEEGQLRPTTINMNVVTPEMVYGDDRAKQASGLAAYYRRILRLAGPQTKVRD